MLISDRSRTEVACCCSERFQVCERPRSSLVHLRQDFEGPPLVVGTGALRLQVQFGGAQAKFIDPVPTGVLVAGL
jgi:hypothetical protein